MSLIDFMDFMLFLNPEQTKKEQDQKKPKKKAK